MGVQVKCDIEISYSGDTVKLTKEDEGNRMARYPNGRSQSATAQAIALLDQTFQHMRSCLVSALEQEEVPRIPVIAIIPPDKIAQVQKEINK